MALSQSALSELLDAFRTGEGVDLIRESVRMVTARTDRNRSHRTDRRRPLRTHRSTHYRTQRSPAPTGGHPGRRRRAADPDTAHRLVLSTIGEPRRRIDQALYAVVMEAYVHGVSSRSVDDLVAALGIDSDISKTEVSRMCACLDEVVGAFRTRSLEHTAFPYAYLHATYLHVRNSSSQVTSMAVVVATGITAEGAREVLGLDVGDSEDEVFWRGFLAWLERRGLSGVRLVISDQHAGLVAALRHSFQGAGHQRCRVHFARNLLAHVPKSHSDMVAAVFRTIFAQPDPATAASTWDEVRDQLAGRFPKIGPLMDQAKAEVLAFSIFPRAHWSKVWSTNPLERVNKEIKRRARVVGSFPDEAAVIRLVGAVLADMHDEWQSGVRRYLSGGSMALLVPSGDTETIVAIDRGE